MLRETGPGSDSRRSTSPLSGSGNSSKDSGGPLLTGTTILSFSTGSGDVGTYQVSQSQTVASEAMTLWDLFDDVTMRIDQAPSVMANNIALAIVNT